MLVATYLNILIRICKAKIKELPDNDSTYIHKLLLEAELAELDIMLNGIEK